MISCVCHIFQSEEELDSVASLMALNKKTVWVILMTGGGHFAGAVFQGSVGSFHVCLYRAASLFVCKHLANAMYSCRQERSASAQDLPPIHGAGEARHCSRTQRLSEPQPRAQVCRSCSEATQRGGASQGKNTERVTALSPTTIIILNTHCHPQQCALYKYNSKCT